MPRLISITLVALLAQLLVACMAPQRGFVGDVEGGVWSSAVDVDFENEDTLSLRRLSVVVRYNSRFRADTLPVVVRVTAPDSRYFEDSVVLHLKRAYHAAAVSASEVVPYREHSRLAMQGQYKFRLTPQLEMMGVEAVGIQIDNE